MKTLDEFELCLQMVLEASGMGIWEYDHANDRMAWSPELCAMTGYPPEQAPSSFVDWVALIHPEDRPAVLARLSAAPAGDNLLYLAEYRLRKQDGAWLWISATGRVVRRDASGNPLCTVGTLEDISQRQFAQQKARQHEEALLRSEALLRAILDATADGILVVGASAKILAMNQSFLNLWRIPSELAAESTDERLLAYVLDKLVEPTEFLCEVRQLYQTDAQHWDTLRFKDGRVIERFTQTLQLDSQRARLWLFRDITAAYHAQETLREGVELKERLEKFAATAPGMIYSFRMRPDGSVCFPYASPNMEKFFGLQPAGLAEDASIIWSLIHPDDLGRFRESLLRSGEARAPGRFEFRVNLPGRGEIWVENYRMAETEADGSVLWHGFLTDITERKHTENDRRESESRFHAIFEQSLFGIALVSVDEWHFIAANPAYCQMLGYTEDELLQMSVADVTHPEDILPEQEFGGLRSEPPHGFLIDKRHIAKNGEVVWTTVASAVIGDATGKPLYRLGMLENITHRHQIEQALKELNDSLEQRVREESEKNRQKDHLLIQQSRFAAMGEMIGNIAHQWRQPLNTLGLALANIEDAYHYHELTDEYLTMQVEVGKQLIQKMSSTIDDFRNFFRPHKEALPFSAAKAITEAISLVSASFRNNHIGIELEPGEDALIHGFANEFTQVLLNLFANAKDAILQNQVVNGKVWVRLALAGQNVIVVVADNGGGIPDPIMDKIFEPYFSTKAMGSGIGLYMSKVIIENSMHGEMSVRNYEGGAEFTLCCRLAVPPKE